MADNIQITAGTGTTILTDDCTTGHAQIVKLAISTDGSATLLPGNATDGLLVNLGANNDVTVTGTVTANLAAGTNNIGDVDVLSIVPGTGATNLGKAEDAAHADGDVGVMMLGVVNNTPSAVTGDYAALSLGTNGGLMISGCTAHDAVDAGSPAKIGAKAIAHGANPTAVAAADRTDLYANRAGVLFTIGGHPNTVTYAHSAITTAVTDTALVTVATGLKIVVTRISVTLDSASTVFPSVRIGFGTANVPALGNAGVLAAHGGVPAGGGFTIGDGSGILGIGADDADLRITTVGNATGNGLQVAVSYFTIES